MLAPIRGGAPRFIALRKHVEPFEDREHVLLI